MLLKIREFSERWTIITVSVLMVLALGLLARSLLLKSERTIRLGELAVDRSMDSQRWQLDLLMKSFVQGLDQQAEYLAMNDRATDEALIGRWLPLLKSRFAIHAISISDERGDEQKLERTDSTWRFTSSIRSGPVANTQVRTWPVRRNDVPPPVAGTPLPDPRQSIWFSQALENRQDAPVWSEALAKDGSRIFQVSRLVRSRSSDSSFHVVHFDIGAATMLGNMAHWSPEISNIALASDSEILTPLDTSMNGSVWIKVLKDWQKDHSTDMFLKTVDGKEWIGRILPLELNGTTIYTGALLGAGALSQWTDQGRLALWTVLGLLVLLGTLLVMVFLQSRGAERRARRHERKSNLQARHLAKAIGEREVLDREVHHRVKNNLQVVSSLLNLQAQRVPGTEARTEFMRGKRRIDSMALVHHKIYRQSDLSAVDLGVFLDDLAKAIAAMFDPESRTVSHSVDTAGITCDADTSIQLGMITCELLANCHQHAFPYATGGHIHIAVRATDDGGYVLLVKDNGNGYDPANVSDSHLGLEVVEALAEQLDGSVRTMMEGGTAVEVTFRPVQHH